LCQGYQASHAQCFKADGQNFGWGQNFAQKKEQKIERCQGAEIGLKRAFLVVKYNQWYP